MDNRKAYRNKRVTVLGAARSGLAAAELLNRHGARVLLSEKGDRPEDDEAVRSLEQAGVATEFNGHSDQALDAGLIVVSPGIPVNSPLIQRAKQKGIPVAGELEIAFGFCKAPVIAVTGSNGKSTTTALIGHMFKTAGRETAVAGNIGSPLAGVAESIPPGGMIVVEVSSFQLETVHRFRPRVAVMLNLTPDHLDRHGDMETYGALKARLFACQDAGDFVVYNAHDQRIRRMVSNARSVQCPFGEEVRDNPCVYFKDGLLRIRNRETESILISPAEMGIKGEHNLANAMAASLAAFLAGLDVESIRQALIDFHGLPHRMEKIRTLDGVDWVNDSKGTNVDSVWYALGSYDRPVILIAGGRDKDSDFSILRDRVNDRVRALILMGEAAGKMAEALEGSAPVFPVASLHEAVLRARELAEPGNVVLLSPACASFDMFRNYEDRGDQFRHLVENLS